MNQQRMLLAAIVLALAAAPTAAQYPAPPSPRRGGLLPQRTPAPGVEPISREELLRRFDLNADGSIDEAEAEMARSRMRRERAEVLRNSGNDPLTGRPRAAPAPAPAKRAVSVPANTSATPPAAGDELLLVPGRPDGNAAPTVRDFNAAAQSAPAAQRPTATTGGVRAGAAPVRPGYGATGPKADLNAGRPLGGAGNTLSGRPSGMQSGGQGMQPQLRGLPPQNAAKPPRQAGQPGSGGAPMSGGMPGRSAPGGAPAAPRPSLFPQSSPRVSAEDIGQ